MAHDLVAVRAALSQAALSRSAGLALSRAAAAAAAVPAGGCPFPVPGGHQRLDGRGLGRGPGMRGPGAGRRSAAGRGSGALRGLGAGRGRRRWRGRRG